MTHLIGTTLALATMASAIAPPAPLAAQAADLAVSMHKATQDGTAEALGTIIIAASNDGTTFTLAPHDLPPGPHGFHVHENANCNPIFLNAARIPAGAAGGHFDPDHAGKHESPGGDGHLGDLPVLVVAADGTATHTLTAPRIKDIGKLKGRSLIIHIGGDNYSDAPAALGGGGGRFACGLVE